jgi:hypothetical protein
MVIRAEIFAGIVPLSTGIATSNLDHEIRRGDHRRAGGGAGQNRERGLNPFVINILTS